MHLYVNETVSLPLITLKPFHDMTHNVFCWIEIYVDDMARARKFYETVLSTQLQDMPEIPGMKDLEMVCFPYAENGPGASGALVRTTGVRPSAGGTLAYFACEDCAAETSRVEAAGGKVVHPKYSIGQHGFCSVCMDTEGNTIGFYSMK